MNYERKDIKQEGDWRVNIKTDKNQIMRLRWQAKYITWRPKYLIPCHLCGHESNSWGHYMKCNNMPAGVQKAKTAFTNQEKTIKTELTMPLMMRDPNLSDLIQELEQGNEVD